MTSQEYLMAVVFQSLLVHNHPDIYDSLHVFNTNLALNVAPSCCACQYFIQGLALHYAYSDTSLYDHVVAM